MLHSNALCLALCNLYLLNLVCFSFPRICLKVCNCKAVQCTQLQNINTDTNHENNIVTQMYNYLIYVVSLGKRLLHFAGSSNISL